MSIYEVHGMPIRMDAPTCGGELAERLSSTPPEQG